MIKSTIRESASTRKIPKRAPHRNFSTLTTQPVITLGELAANATDGERALLAAGVDIYQQCGRLVRPIVEIVAAAKGRKTRVVRLVEVDDTYLRDLLSRHALWQTHVTRENKLIRKDPPMDVARTIRARVGEWRFPTISGVISTPTLREDGSLLTAPGYDEASGFILFGALDIPSIPPNPSRDDALRALAILEDLLVEFPFVDTISESVALSALITPVARGAFPVAPMHAFSATAAGSGKSYLADVAAAIATGKEMPVISARQNRYKDLSQPFLYTPAGAQTRAGGGGCVACRHLWPTRRFRPDLQWSSHLG